MQHLKCPVLGKHPPGDGEPPAPRRAGAARLGHGEAGGSWGVWGGAHRGRGGRGLAGGDGSCSGSVWRASSVTHIARRAGERALLSATAHGGTWGWTCCRGEQPPTSGIPLQFSNYSASGAKTRCSGHAAGASSPCPCCCSRGTDPARGTAAPSDVPKLCYCL